MFKPVFIEGKDDKNIYSLMNIQNQNVNMLNEVKETGEYFDREQIRLMTNFNFGEYTRVYTSFKYRMASENLTRRILERCFEFSQRKEPTEDYIMDEALLLKSELATYGITATAVVIDMAAKHRYNIVFTLNSHGIPIMLIFYPVDNTELTIEELGFRINSSRTINISEGVLII